jgi:hypothetical protein
MCWFKVVLILSVSRFVVNSIIFLRISYLEELHKADFCLFFLSVLDVMNCVRIRKDISIVET